MAGAADTLVVLSRDRQEGAGLVEVTGRDVAEGERKVERSHRIDAEEFYHLLDGVGASTVNPNQSCVSRDAV